MARTRRSLSDCLPDSSDCLPDSSPPPSTSNFYPPSSPPPATSHSPAPHPPLSYSSPPPHPPSISKTLHGSSKTITLLVVLFLCALVVGFLFLTYLTVRKQRNSRTRTRTTGTRRSRPTPNEDSEIPPTLDLDLLHDNHGDPVLDHPIWYIRTVGLQQSVIESIAIFKYKRGVIEGTDCSVCLSEFEEDESLRLLPKCSHAFHIHCIDTWLSSHQNCPLCRAPIVSATEDVPNCSTVITITEQDQLDDSSTVHPDPESLINNHSQRFDHLFHEVNMRLAAADQFSDEDEDRVSGVSVDKNPRQGRNSGTRVLSDLGDHRRSVLKEEEEEEEGVGRRSVSMDASSAAHLTSSFLAMVKADHGEGCSSNEPAAAAAELKNSKKKKKMKSSSLMMDGIEEGDKSITSRVTKTYSFGRFLQRSTSSASASSSGGFFSLSSSRH